MDPTGKSVESVLNFMRGAPDDVFQLHLRLPDGSGEHVVEIRPRPADCETVFGIDRGGDDGWRHTLNEDKSIGYIRISQFGPGTHMVVADVLTTHRAVRGWILDMRFNEGGLFSSAVQSSELFVGLRRVMTIYTGPDRFSAVSYDGEDEATLKNRPIVCLVNGKTRSAAESVAACLQDQGKALIVGERTAGRAELQNILPVLGPAELKLTTAVLVRPSGQHLSRYMSRGEWEDDWGVTPDAGMECRLSQKETDLLAVDFRDAEAIYDPKFRPKPRVVDRQLALALTALRARIDSN
jgi:carboxyl-terminal processing protease